MDKCTEYFKCEYCDYTSNRNYNLSRHMIIKHIENEKAPKANPTAFLDNQKAPKANPTAFLDNPKAPKTNSNNLKPNQCEKCEKILCRRSIYNKHILHCKGKINKLECQICNQVFTLPPAKYRHQKNCKIKKEEEQKIIIQNIENQNNITNITTNNITNNINNTINIISYSNDLECEFVKTDAFHKKIKRLLKRYGNEISMIKDYNKELFSIKENQCIKKTNLQSPHSKVHIGNNKWIVKPDKEVYSQMVSTYANDFCNLIMNESNRKYHKNLETRLDYLIDNYINGTDEEQKELNDQHKELQTDLKVYIYNNDKM